MTVLTVEEAQPRLKELLEQAAHGEPVVITTETGVRLRVLLDGRTDSDEALERAPVGPQGRVFGAWAGKVELGSEFFEPLPDDELDLWEGNSPRGRKIESVAAERHSETNREDH